MIKCATDFLNFAFIAFGGLITVIVIVPWLLLLIVPLSFGFVHLTRTFIRASRQIKRRSAASRSPIFGAFSDLLRGANSVRVFRANAQLQRRFHSLLDYNSSAEFCFEACSRWLSLHLDFISSSVVLALAVIGVLTAERIGAGILGVALAQSLQLVICHSLFC